MWAGGAWAFEIRVLVAGDGRETALVGLDGALEPASIVAGLSLGRSQERYRHHPGIGGDGRAFAYTYLDEQPRSRLLRDYTSGSCCCVRGASGDIAEPPHRRGAQR